MSGNGDVFLCWRCLSTLRRQHGGLGCCMPAELDLQCYEGQTSSPGEHLPSNVMQCQICIPSWKLKHGHSDVPPGRRGRGAAGAAMPRRWNPTRRLRKGHRDWHQKLPGKKIPLKIRLKKVYVISSPPKRMFQKLGKSNFFWIGFNNLEGSNAILLLWDTAGHVKHEALWLWWRADITSRAHESISCKILRAAKKWEKHHFETCYKVGPYQL